MLVTAPPRTSYVAGRGTGGAVATAAFRRGVVGGRLRAPVGAFVIVYGVAKLAGLIDWPRLHRDAVAMLGLGSGTVTVLLVASTAVELALTAGAVLALVRADDRLLAAAVAGWTADLAALTIAAAVGGDLGRVVEHGIAFVAFGVLLAALYLYGGVRPRRPAPPEPDPGEPAAADATRRDLGTAEPTRQDLPVRRTERTRQDLPVHRPEPTRLDLPVRRRETD
jgi:hypothetical protein